MNSKRTVFSSEKLRKLSKNPFVDRKMLQFIKERTPQRGNEQPPSSGSPRTSHSLSKPVISDEAAKLIAAAISGLLRS